MRTKSTLTGQTSGSDHSQNEGEEKIFNNKTEEITGHTEWTNIQVENAHGHEEDHSQSFSPVLVMDGEIKEKRTKKMFLLVLALAGSLSICSIGWVVKKTRAEKKTAIGAATTVKESTPEEAVASEETNQKEKDTRKNWSELITVANSNYAYGVLGGINNLSVLFTNKTDYPLEEITAKVVYIKSNGKPWKTKFVSVFNVPAHSTKKLAVPKVNRGKSVEVAVSKIVSKKMHFRYEAGKKGTDGGDPYLWK